MERPTEEEALRNIEKYYNLVNGRFESKYHLTNRQIKILLKEREILKKNPQITREKLETEIINEFSLSYSFLKYIYKITKNFLYERY